jgi:membrane-associated phospholipid phosphatase
MVLFFLQRQAFDARARRERLFRAILLGLTLLCVSLRGNVLAQEAPEEPAKAWQATDPFYAPVPHRNETNFLRNLAADQKDILASPFRLKPRDARWLSPFSGITAGLIATDSESSFAMKSSHPGALNTFSDAGVASAIGFSGTAYFWGRITHNERAREAGVLASEAMLDVLPLDTGIRYSTGRLRPVQSNYQNVFFQRGTSFPSNHAAVMFAFASVVAHEYPSPIVQAGAYGLAGAVSLARAGSGQHFLSDLFVGGLIGYETGRHVFNARHNRNLDDDLVAVARETTAPNPNNMASTYVPLDSWVYPAIERLVARGYINTAFVGFRPYTRLSCARMLVELNTNVEAHTDLPHDIYQLKKSLEAEFADEMGTLEGRPFESIRLESLYSRTMGISGTPLADSAHFGQTIVNDYGRPYEEGASNVTGFSARAEDGRFAFYVNGEYQHAPSAPAYSLPVREVIATVDQRGVQPAAANKTIDHFRLLDTYAAVKMLGMDFSVGKQSLWWGPGESGSMLMSNNAEPFWMLQVNRSDPLYIPGLSKFLGPFRSAFYFGKLSGHDLSPVGPYFWGQKISFKPTENLELGFTRNAVFAGEGHVPLTFGSFWNSLSSFNDVTTSVKFSRNDPGARHASFDFYYRVPKLRRWLTIYLDSLVHDDVSPISAPQRSAWNPGIYLTHFPALPKLDFRVEAVSTDPPVPQSDGGLFMYYEVVYHNLYLNNRNLMGNWIGREGKGYQAWSTYHLSPKSSLQAGFRYAKIAKDFIPEGTTQYDANLSAILRVNPDLEVKSFVQYESWLVPVLNPTRQHDLAASVQLTWWPHAGWKH